MSRIHLLSFASLITLTNFATGCTERPEPTPALDPRLLYDFEDCDDLLGYAKGNAKDLIEEYGSPWPYADYGVDEGFGTGGDGGEPVGDSGGDRRERRRQRGGGKDYSGTNVQEVGVDEPDIVKTDGERILAVAQGKLHFVDTSGVSPQLRGSVELGEGGWDAQLFMHEDRALLMQRTYFYDYGRGRRRRAEGSRRPGRPGAAARARPRPVLPGRTSARWSAWSRSTSPTRTTCASSATCTSTATC
jgi:hypothetical protein